MRFPTSKAVPVLGNQNRFMIALLYIKFTFNDEAEADYYQVFHKPFLKNDNSIDK